MPTLSSLAAAAKVGNTTEHKMTTVHIFEMHSNYKQTLLTHWATQSKIEKNGLLPVWHQAHI